MIHLGRPQAERLGALALAALGGICGLLLWSDTERLGQHGALQRELLAQLAVAHRDVAILPEGPLPEFDSLFPGLRVGCVATPAGHMLQLLPATAMATATEVAKCSR